MGSKPKPRIIEGFVSIEGEDRQGDSIDPTTFNIEQFMARPCVYFNHEAWKTPEGNEIPVGHPLDMAVGIARTIRGDRMHWQVVSETGKKLGVIERRLNPGVRDGTRGLWAKVAITVDPVWEMIEDGDLNAFSWFGGIERSSTGRIADIDLMEISPVNIGAHPVAGFAVAAKMLRSRAGTMMKGLKGTSAPFHKGGDRQLNKKLDKIEAQAKRLKKSVEQLQESNEIDVGLMHQLFKAVRNELDLGDDFMRDLPTDPGELAKLLAYGLSAIQKGGRSVEIRFRGLGMLGVKGFYGQVRDAIDELEANERMRKSHDGVDAWEGRLQGFHD